MGQNRSREAGAVVEVAGASFAAEVLESGQPVLVEFWAAWCGPCRMVAPEVEAVEALYAGRVKVARCDVDADPDVAARYGVMSIPTLILFRGGVPAGRVVGYRPRRELQEFLDGLL
jgi:thioredoxin 1